VSVISGSRGSVILGQYRNYEFSEFLILTLSLRRHEKNHTRSAKCNQCQKAFAFTKDLERHENTVHNLTVIYHCPYEWCRDYIKPALDGAMLWGFRRKDHWQKHMKDKHQTSSQALRSIQRHGIPMMVLKDEIWFAVLPKTSQAQLVDPSTVETTNMMCQGQENSESSAQP